MKYRQLIVLILLLVSLSACSLVNTFRIRNANDNISPIWADGQTTANLVTHYIGVKPYVEISINGIDGFKFLIDTGASFSILMDTEKVKNLQLPPGYELQLHGWGDQEHSPAHQTKASIVSLENVSFSDVTFAYLPLSSNMYYLKPEELIFDGVLGHDILHHFSVQFDKQSNQISIRQNKYQPIGDEIEIPFDVSFSKLSIQSVIDFGSLQKVTQELVIDTGSRHYLKVNAAFINNNDIVLPKAKITAADFGLSGQTIHQRVTIPSLQIADLNINNVKTNIIGTIDGDEDEYWIVGSALLNQYVSVIDYHTSTLYLRPYENSDFKSKYNCLFRKICGSFQAQVAYPLYEIALF